MKIQILCKFAYKSITYYVLQKRIRLILVIVYFYCAMPETKKGGIEPISFSILFYSKPSEIQVFDLNVFIEWCGTTLHDTKKPHKIPRAPKIWNFNSSRQFNINNFIQKNRFIVYKLIWTAICDSFDVICHDLLNIFLAHLFFTRNILVWMDIHCWN